MTGNATGAIITSRPMALVKRHSLLFGLLLMYALTWVVHLSNAGVLPFRLPFPLYLLGGWGFGVAAIAMTWLTLGPRAVIDLLRRFLLWRIGWKWYASILIIPATYAFGASLHALVNGIPLDFTATPAVAATGSVTAALALGLPVFVANVLGNGEEIGWRGYALPRLQSRYASLFSALVLGLIWGVWHIAVYIRSFNPTWFALVRGGRDRQVGADHLGLQRQPRQPAVGDAVSRHVEHSRHPPAHHHQALNGGPRGVRLRGAE